MGEIKFFAKEPGKANKTEWYIVKSNAPVSRGLFQALYFDTERNAYIRSGYYGGNAMQLMGEIASIRKDDDYIISDECSLSADQICTLFEKKGCVIDGGYDGYGRWVSCARYNGQRIPIEYETFAFRASVIATICDDAVKQIEKLLEYKPNAETIIIVSDCRPSTVDIKEKKWGCLPKDDFIYSKLSVKHE